MTKTEKQLVQKAAEQLETSCQIFNAWADVLGRDNLQAERSEHIQKLRAWADERVILANQLRHILTPAVPGNPIIE